MLLKLFHRLLKMSVDMQVSFGKCVVQHALASRLSACQGQRLESSVSRLTNVGMKSGVEIQVTFVNAHDSVAEIPSLVCRGKLRYSQQSWCRHCIIHGYSRQLNEGGVEILSSIYLQRAKAF